MAASLEGRGHPTDFAVRFRRECGSLLPVLVWQLPCPMRAIAVAPHGDGIGIRRWVINAQVPRLRGRRDLGHQMAKLGVSLGLRGKGVGMLTTTDVRQAWTGRDGSVGAVATVGLVQRTPATGSNGPGSPGVAMSINVVAVLPEPASDAALINAVATVAEARGQALRDAGLVATNTADNAICILCPTNDHRNGTAGPRSQWEAALARAAHASVFAGARAEPVRLLSPH